MFRAFSCPLSRATTTAVAASGLPSKLGVSSAVGRGRAGRPEAATTVVVARDNGHENAQNMLSCI
jgi:hypothetical protein